MKLDFSLLHRTEFVRPALSPYFTLTSTGATSLDGTTALEVDDDVLPAFVDFFSHDTGTAAAELQPVLELMARNGMIIESLRTHGKGVSWLTLAHDLFHEINAEIVRYYRPESFIYRLINKEATIEEIIEWLRRCFHYTHSAYRHISGVVGNPTLSESERMFWEQFRADEQSHWKIYSRIFAFLGLDIEGLTRAAPQKDVAAFTDFLRETGASSMHEYGALLYMMEVPPTASEMTADPQFGVLVGHYGFPKEAVRPLWDHACYNEESGHEDIWFNVLRSKCVYSLDERQRILEKARTHCLLSYNWNLISAVGAG